MAGLVGAVGAGVGVTVALGMAALGAALERAHEERAAATMARLAASSLAPAFQSGDAQTATTRMALAAAETGALRLEIYGRQGELLAAAGPSGSGRAATAPVAGPTGALGAVRVRGVAEPPVWWRNPLLGGLGLLGAALALAAAWAGAEIRRMCAPLLEITRFAERASAQSLGRRISLGAAGGGDLGQLAEAINQMLSRFETALSRARKLALVDPVTELPNEEQFRRHVAATLAEQAQSGGLAAVFVIALDRFARSTEAMGPEAAQELIALVAQRLSRAVRIAERAVHSGDAAEAPALAARLGALEFGILAPRLETTADIARFAQAVTTASAQPIEIEGRKIALGQVMGIAILPKDAPDADAALRNARLALRAARQEHRAARVFTRSLDRAAAARASLERDIRDGLERREFVASFQPKVEMRGGRIIGCEALARWVRPEGAPISPAVFIPAAEEAGLITEISEQIMMDACTAAAQWTSAGFEATVAVNVSALQFNSDRFAHRVMRILHQTGLPPSCLELEITESVAIGDIDRARRLVAPLKEAGVRLALDDFGTGHSSLAALSRLPFDTLKIDQKFIRGLQGDRHAPALVEAILAMAVALGYQTTAEGVETDSQARFLRHRGCLFGQGFLFGPAMPARDFFNLLRTQEGEPLIALQGFAA